MSNRNEKMIYIFKELLNEYFASMRGIAKELTFEDSHHYDYLLEGLKKIVTKQDSSIVDQALDNAFDKHFSSNPEDWIFYLSVKRQINQLIYKAKFDECR